MANCIDGDRINRIDITSNRRTDGEQTMFVTQSEGTNFSPTTLSQTLTGHKHNQVSEPTQPMTRYAPLTGE